MFGGEYLLKHTHKHTVAVTAFAVFVYIRSLLVCAVFLPPLNVKSWPISYRQKLTVDASISDWPTSQPSKNPMYVFISLSTPIFHYRAATLRFNTPATILCNNKSLASTRGQAVGPPSDPPRFSCSDRPRPNGRTLEQPQRLSVSHLLI